MLGGEVFSFDRNLFTFPCNILTDKKPLAFQRYAMGNSYQHVLYVCEVHVRNRTGCVLNTQNPKSYIIWGPLKFQLDTNMFRGTLSHTILMGIVDISQRTFFKPGCTFSTGNAKGTALSKFN